MKAYRKFVVAIVGLIVLLLHHNGTAIAKDISDQVSSALTALAVFIIPNE